VIQPYPDTPAPDCISCSEADDSYSLGLLKQHAQAAHDRGYSVGWDAGFAHGIAQARAELIAELKPVAYRYPKSGVDNGYYYEDSLDGEEPRFKRLWQPLAVIPSTKEGHEDQ
jgi:hypothetical protein